MISRLRLYQIPWSHFCDKVRWALDFKEIPYETIDFNAFGKTKGLERAPKGLRKLFPIIEDTNIKDENSFHCDSTPILLYLNSQYPRQSKSLFPLSSSDQHQQVVDVCLRLDSELGLYTRRIAYVQILHEKSSILSIFLSGKFSWAQNTDDIRSILISPFICCFMIARFRLHRIREDRIKEKTEQTLLEFAGHLRTNEFIIGRQFSAADLTFCSLVKPLIHVPYFYNDRRFQIIFDYHERIRRNYDPKYPNIDNVIEKIIDKHRLKMKQIENSVFMRIRKFFRRINFVQRFFIAFMTMLVKYIYGPATDNEEIPQFKQTTTDSTKKREALNDQQRINIKSIPAMIKFFLKYQCHFLFTMPSQAEYLSKKM